jgi:signal transduction histidine kinase
MNTKARALAVDASAAAVVTGIQVAAAYAIPGAHGHAAYRIPGALGLALLIAGGLALLARRRFPVPVLAVVLGTTLGAGALHVAVVWPAMIVAFVTAVRRRERRAAIASLVIGYGVSVADSRSLVFALALLAGLVALLSAAELSRAHSERAAADRRGREEAALRRATEERLAIARDLHDVVAHSISVINVQASTALHLMDRQPDRAREALTAIHEVSRQALAELGAVLGTLRGTAPDGSGRGRAPLAPVPGLARLGELAQLARSAGLAVDLAAEGAARDLPAGVDAAAYRIVQEALTNAVRHSGGTSARVLLRYAADRVEVEVNDDGTGPGNGGSRAPGAAPPAVTGTGRGLAGMAERARALGGTLDAGPGPGGGFRVLARLPAPSAAAVIPDGMSRRP